MVIETMSPLVVLIIKNIFVAKLDKNKMEKVKTKQKTPHICT